MKLRELIMMEDGEASMATTSSDIASVAYPLFVRGKSNKEKRKNARAAVGQKYVPGPKGISTGVFESSLEELANTSLDVKEPKGMYNVNDRKQTTYKVFKFKSGKNTFLINFTVKGAPAFGKKQNWNAVNVAFGVKEKQDDYSFGDEIDTDLTARNKNQFLIYSTVINTIRRFITEYNTEIDEIIMQGAGERQAVMYQRFFQSAGKYFPGWHYDGKHSLVRDVPRKPVKKVKEQGAAEVEEAHVLNHDNVIYRLDRDNPMSDTEVLVLGGAGRYSLKALRDKARREAAELAQDLSVEHGGAFRRSAINIKQLTNTINTIVAAYNELARIRRKGGRGSRGITDEDANFIRECIRVVEQAAQNYRLMEGLAVEPDPQGYATDNITNPQYTVVVNTVSDLDWYKIGMYWHNKIIDPHEFGQADSDTVMVAQGPEEYKEMIAKLDKMGVKYMPIGGSDKQPEIHNNDKV